MTDKSPGTHPYPAYKTSGAEWIGDVPEHWEVGKLREILAKTNERNRPDLPLLSVVREKGVILRDITSMDENHNYIPDDLSNYKVVHQGQLAMNKMKAWQGSYGVSEHHGIVSPAYFVFDIAGVSGGYLNTAIRSKVYVPFFAQASDGVRIGQWDLSQARMGEIPLAVPPLPEQRAIVRYLDHVDRRIRRYVGTKRKLIALLEEEKQAVINQAVTRGLDPSVPLKPSGVEWLGDVPEHWDLMQLGRIGRFSKGIGGTKEDEAPDGVPCIRYGDLYKFHEFHILRSSSFVTELKSLDYTPIQFGDILFAGSGETIEEIGKSAVNLLKSQACCGSDIVLLRPQIAIDAKFSGYAVDCSQGRYQKSCMGRGITVMHIYGDELKYLWIAIPPMFEQAAIVQYLDKTTADIDAAITRARRQIELVEEYRTRLIADVVTGKLDVREAAAQLPEEPGDADGAEADGPAEDVASQPTVADAV